MQLIKMDLGGFDILLKCELLDMRWSEMNFVKYFHSAHYRITALGRMPTLNNSE